MPTYLGMEPFPFFPEGTATSRQQELETMCGQLQQQVAEMEVRDCWGCLPLGS